MLPDFPIRLERLPRELTFVRVLEEFEGDILTEFRATNGSGLYLEKWCARDGTKNRYLLVRTELRSVAEYLGRRISMLQLLNGSSDGGGFIVDKDGGKVAAVFAVRLDSLPDGYLPKPSAFHDEGLRPTWRSVPQSFLLDTQWDAKLLATIERRYLDVFGFVYLTKPNANRKLPAITLSYDYDGGYPLMHTFNRIRFAPPAADRARAVGVSANSPGVLTIDAPSETVEQLSKCFSNLVKSATAYEVLHIWSRLAPTSVDRLPQSAYSDLARLCQSLGIDISSLFPEPNDNHPKPTEVPRYVLAAGKLVASFYRKMWKLLEPEAGVEFLSFKVDRTNLKSPAGVFDDDSDEGES